MTSLLIIIVLIGLAGVIGNQYAGLRRMDKLQETLEAIRDELKGSGRGRP